MNKNDDRYKRNPREIIVSAVSMNNQVGSSTCVVACLDEEKPFLYTANLGDSGYLLLRKQGVDLVSVFRSEEQQHSFNFPFQVGTGGDDPATAEENFHEVQNNDILVVASDGLWDNLFDVNIVDIIRPFIRDHDEILDPVIVAELIAEEAENKSN